MTTDHDGHIEHLA